MMVIPASLVETFALAVVSLKFIPDHLQLLNQYTGERA